MAHHQGMSLLALNDVLHRDAMQRRFHGDVRIRAVESLLFERMPMTRMLPETQEEPAPARVPGNQEPAERTWTEETAVPRVHLHGNGRYALMVTNSGAGYSRWNEFDITRWRSDSTLRRWGSYVFIRDLRRTPCGRPPFSPWAAASASARPRFLADRAEFRRRVLGIETIMEVTVAAEDDVELRRVTITNRSTRTRQLEFTSYVELALAPHRADTAHPAFAKMFVETERVSRCSAAGTPPARVRPTIRKSGRRTCWSGATGDIQYETDRAEFLGRAGTIANPAGAAAGSDGRERHGARSDLQSALPMRRWSRGIGWNWIS